MKNKRLNTWGDMDIDKIEKAYNFVKSLHEYELCNKKTMDSIRGMMQKELPEYLIKCDEENNPPKVVDSGHIRVKVVEHTHPPGTYNYVDIIF